ncbi:MAG TPA: hypothetical protein VIU15_13445 [Streptomyces sp.]
MGTTPRPDFARVAKLRDGERELIGEAARQGLIPHDIATALAAPGVSDLLLLQRFEVVMDLGVLTGPGSGAVEVPRRLADGEIPERVNVEDPQQCAAFYRVVLLRGTTADQAALINRDALVRLWPRRLAPQTVTEVWEGRFPELRAT